MSEEEALKMEMLDSLTYEASLTERWKEKEAERGFDWELEKLRRRFSGMEISDKGEWVKKSGHLDWTFSPAKRNLLDSEREKFR